MRRHDDAFAATTRAPGAAVAFHAPPVSGPALPHFDAVPLFRCLNADERNLLGPVCRAVAYERGEEVFREGDEARARARSSDVIGVEPFIDTRDP